MTFNDFAKKFTVNPETDIAPYFRLDKILDFDTHKHSGCPHCTDKLNIHRFDSVPWTGVIKCTICNSLMVVYYSDRMGGNHTDTIYVYKEKESINICEDISGTGNIKCHIVENS